VNWLSIGGTFESIFTTTVAFLVRPRSFQPLSLGEAESGITGLRHTRPLTYLFVAFIALTAFATLFFAWLSKIHPGQLPKLPTVDWSIAAFSKLDFKVLFLLCAQRSRDCN
jgi:hypothetical protein